MRAKPLKALLIDYGGVPGANAVALCVCRAYGKLLELVGAEFSIVQSPDADESADLLIIVPRQEPGVSVPPECREAMWRYLMRHSSTPFCVVLPTASSRRVAPAVLEARLLARLDVIPPTNPPLVPQPRILMAHEAVQQILGDQLDGEMQRGCLNDWVKEVAESVDKSGEQVAFLSGLTEVAAACEGGKWLSDHGIKGSRLFQRDAIATFRAWCDSLKAMKADKANAPLNLSTLDDQPGVLESFLLPPWLWTHSNVKITYTRVDRLKETIDSCSRITDRSDDLADVFLLDMDWRHAGRGKNDNSFKIDKPDRLVPEDTVSHFALSHLGKYLLELIVRYNEQYRNAAFHAVASALLEAPKDDETRKRQQFALERWKKDYIDVHNEGVIVYHYLKAFDERLPTVVFTAAHEDTVKLRQTAGPKTEFVSKATLMTQPDEMLHALRGVIQNRQRKEEDYKRAALLSQALLDWHSKELVCLDPKDDGLVKKSGKRVMALLEIRTANGALQPFFGRKFELSQPTGSMCAERSAIAAALAKNPILGKRGEDLFKGFELIAVLGDPKNGSRQNPCPPCGVCSEWIDKLQEENGAKQAGDDKCPFRLDIIMFSRCREHFCYYPRNDRISY